MFLLLFQVFLFAHRYYFFLHAVFLSILFHPWAQPIIHAGHREVMLWSCRRDKKIIIIKKAYTFKMSLSCSMQSSTWLCRVEACPFGIWMNSRCFVSNYVRHHRVWTACSESQLPKVIILDECFEQRNISLTLPLQQLQHSLTFLIKVKTLHKVYLSRCLGDSKF